jgi:hypothetical protein
MFGKLFGWRWWWSESPLMDNCHGGFRFRWQAIQSANSKLVAGRHFTIVQAQGSVPKYDWFDGDEEFERFVVRNESQLGHSNYYPDRRALATLERALSNTFADWAKRQEIPTWKFTRTRKAQTLVAR